MQCDHKELLINQTQKRIMEVVLHRVYLEKASHGLLTIEGRKVCLTIELPWVTNQRSISCIPEGEYELRRRYSPRFKEHFEVVDVPDRSYILFHPANNALRDLRGCIAPVSEIIGEGWGSRSKIAMSKLLHTLQGAIVKEGVVLKVRQATDEKILSILNTGKL